MARPPRLLAPDATYHVFGRAHKSGLLFRDDGERRLFLVLLGRAAARRKWLVLSFCLMNSHFHLVLRTPQPDLGDGMREILGKYARRVNLRRGEHGHVFAERYGCRLVGDDQQLVAVLRYVALNPVAAGLCAHAADWRWSSTPALILGRDDGISAVDEVTALLASLTGRQQAHVYRAFLEDAGHPAPEALPPVEAFVSREDTEITFDAPSVLRAYEHGFSVREIADQLDCGIGTVSRMLGRIRDPDGRPASAERA